MFFPKTILGLFNNLFISKCSIICVCTKHSSIFPGSGVSAIGLRSPTSLGIEILGIGTIVTILHIVTAVVNATVLKIKEQLRSFLGLCKYMYMSKFVKNFASKAAPLHAMMKDKVNFVWAETHQKVFDNMKSKIAKRPTLSTFDSFLNIETIVTTDASQYGL